MKVTYNWIKEFCDVKMAPQALAERLTMAGLSVASLEQKLDDWVYDIEVTSNRPDWLSVRGIVREVAAITGEKFKKGCSIEHRAKSLEGRKNVLRPEPYALNDFTLRIDDLKGCGLYHGSLIIGVSVGPSPAWLSQRLESLGLRPVNNVVDITNYCMLTYGQPLHAFDFDKLGKSAVVVRRAAQGEKLILIDGSEKTLDPEILLIADAGRPIAAAGIMGGRDTEVHAGTKNILLESAYFDPVTVRKGARRLGVASDASYRFERGVDIATVKVALEEATRIICEVCGGSWMGTKTAGSLKPKKEKKILFSLAHTCDVLGLDISEKQATRALRQLGFGVKARKKDFFEVTVPAVRRDVKDKEDITEEIARSFGYDKIPLTSPQIRPFCFEEPAIQRVEPLIREILVNGGLKEVITYSLTEEDAYRKSGQETDGKALFLENPLSVDLRMLRTSLAPSLLECAGRNFNQGNKDFEFFEIGHVFEAGRERVMLGVLLAGSRRTTWTREAKPYGLFDIKGILETIAGGLQLSEGAFRPVEEKRFQSGSGSAWWLADKRIGVFGQVTDAVKSAWSIKGKEDIFLAEVELEDLAASAELKKRFSALENFPKIVRDISMVTDASSPFESIKKTIGSKAGRYLKGIRVSDTYQGKEIPDGKMGLHISVTYGLGDRTLTDQEVNGIHQQVLDGLVNELKVTLR